MKLSSKYAVTNVVFNETFSKDCHFVEIKQKLTIMTLLFTRRLVGSGFETAILDDN